MVLTLKTDLKQMDFFFRSDLILLPFLPASIFCYNQ